MEYLSENILAPLKEWTVWSQRENITPDRQSTEEGEKLICKRFGDCGKLLTVAPVEEGATYEVKFTFSVEDMTHPKMSTRFVVDTYADDGKPIQTEYAPKYEKADGIYTATGTFVALKGSAKAEVIAMIMSTDNGSMLVREASLRKIAPIPPRKVTVAAGFLNCYDNKDNETVESRFEKILALCDKAGQQKVDIVSFPESICTFMLHKSIKGETSQPVPGPWTEALGEKAKKYGMYILFNMGEIGEDGLRYNTNVVINKDGSLLGKYRKCHITYNALNNGSSPGHEYNVFDTDFGRIGTVTCFDQFFPESIRSLAVQGAEIVFVPTIGDGHVQLQARAMENSIYIVVPGVNHSKKSDQPMSRIISPIGEILAGTCEDMGLAISTIDLNKPNSAFWFSVGPRYGDKNRITKLERRPETYGELFK